MHIKRGFLFTQQNACTYPVLYNFQTEHNYILLLIGTTSLVRPYVSHGKTRIDDDDKLDNDNWEGLTLRNKHIDAANFLKTFT